MDKLEYISGDLVMTNGVPLGTAKDVVYRVTSSDPSKTLKLGDGTVLKGVVRLENIEGAEFGDKGYLFYGCIWKATFYEDQDRTSDFIMLPRGSIKKLIGRDLSWNDEPVELKGE